MPGNFLTENKMPYCPGCGHILATKSLAKAFEKMNLDPLDIVLVSDIGCSGLVDPLLSVHTIHGLHGRSNAMAMGVSYGLNNPDKKVIVIQGDGGATIGLQHILEAARRNVNMTLLVQNNFIYGMTGGQQSGLTTKNFQSSTTNNENLVASYDLCELASKAGAAYCTRINSAGDYSGKLKEAMKVDGFSLVEITGLCVPYGIKKAKELEVMAREEVTVLNDSPSLKINPRATNSLFDPLPVISEIFESTLEKQINIIIAGSAGGGVQSTAELIAIAGMSAGLYASKKGAYPITVGTGFSTAEIILSRDEIRYAGIDSPDVMIIVTKDGLDHVKGRTGKNTFVIIDEQLISACPNYNESGPYHGTAGKRGSALFATALWIQQSQIFPFDAFTGAIENHKHKEKLKLIIDKTKTYQK